MPNGMLYTRAPQISVTRYGLFFILLGIAHSLESRWLALSALYFSRFLCFGPARKTNTEKKRITESTEAARRVLGYADREMDQAHLALLWKSAALPPNAKGNIIRLKYSA